MENTEEKGVDRGSSASVVFERMKALYADRIGQSAMYVTREERRKVQIVEVHDKYVRLKYQTKMFFQRTDLYTCVHFASLLTGDERIELREVVEREVVLLDAIA